MITSEHTNEVLAALLRSKANFLPIVKAETVKVTTKTGRTYTYHYADLSAIQEGTEAALNVEGLLIISGGQPGADGTVECVTRLMHASSEQWLESRLPWSDFDEIKTLGAFLSYARRFSTVALLDLTAEDDLDATVVDGDHVQRQTKAVASPSTSTNGHAPAPEPDADLEHPTESHIAALANLALTECHEDKEVYYQRIRRTMGLKDSASVAPRLLTRTMSMAQYMDLFGFYRRLESQLAPSNQQETAHGNVGPTPAPPTTTPAPVEESPAVPQPSEASAEESSSAEDNSPEGLLAFAVGLGLKEDVSRRVIGLHAKNPAKTRQVFLDAAERNKRVTA